MVLPVKVVGPYVTTRGFPVFQGLPLSRSISESACLGRSLCQPTCCFGVVPLPLLCTSDPAMSVALKLGPSGNVNFCVVPNISILSCMDSELDPAAQLISSAPLHSCAASSPDTGVAEPRAWKHAASMAVLMAVGE